MHDHGHTLLEIEMGWGRGKVQTVGRGKTVQTGWHIKKKKRAGFGKCVSDAHSKAKIYTNPRRRSCLSMRKMKLRDHTLVRREIRY